MDEQSQQTRNEQPTDEQSLTEQRVRPASQKSQAKRTAPKQGSGAKKRTAKTSADGTRRSTKKRSSTQSGTRTSKPKRSTPSSIGYATETDDSLVGSLLGKDADIRRITLIAAAAALLVAAIAWFATDGFGMNHKSDTPVTTSSSQEVTVATDDINQQVESALKALTLEQKVAQMFILTPEGLTGANLVTSAGDVTRLAISDRPIGGLCYFDQNLESPKQTREMIATVQQYSKDSCGLPMFMCVDEEGGEVSRIASKEAFGVENVGDMRAIGDSGDTQKAAQAATTIANYLTSLGFNVDFAPVADIANIEESSMATRSFGTTADAVSPMVEAQVRAFTDNNIICAAKHFPGIGNTTADSHYAAITTERSLGELQNEELKPFQAAIAAGVPMIMVGHLGTPNATGNAGPASLAPEVITDILRNQLGYDGIVITDSLAMGAITESYENAEVGVKAIQAGADIILMPANFDATFRGVMDAVNQGTISEDRINESVRRILKVKLSMKDNTPTKESIEQSDDKNKDAAATDEAKKEEAPAEQTEAVATEEVADTTGYSEEVVYDDSSDTGYDESYDESSYGVSYDEGYYDDSGEEY